MPARSIRNILYKFSYGLAASSVVLTKTRKAEVVFQAEYERKDRSGEQHGLDQFHLNECYCSELQAHITTPGAIEATEGLEIWSTNHRSRGKGLVISRPIKTGDGV